MKSPSSKHRLTASFKFALKGIGFMLKTQRNARIHTVATVIVLSLAIILRLTVSEWMWLIVAIAMVFAAELFNTAIEFLTDLVSPGYNDKAGKAKDIGAGAVLICACAAALIGLIVFLPKLWKLIE